MSDWKLPRGAGYKSFWLVIKGSNRNEIVEKLELTNIEKDIWDEGLLKASSYNNNTVMVSDDFNGMNFIIGDTLSSLAYNDDLLKYISKCFKEVYFFFTHRVSESHGFAKFKDGEIIRQYFSDEEQIIDIGEKTDFEKENEYNYPSNFDECFEDEFTTIEEDDIILIAEKWTGIDEENYPYDDVLCGNMDTLFERFPYEFEECEFEE